MKKSLAKIATFGFAAATIVGFWAGIQFGYNPLYALLFLIPVALAADAWMQQVSLEGSAALMRAEAQEDEKFFRKIGH